MATVGRNDPCPCGSGRKFKHCCLRIQDGEDSQRVRLRFAEGALVPALFSYAAQEFGDEFFDEAWDEFFLWTDVPDDIEHSKEFGTTFDPFFVFDFVPDASEDPLPARESHPISDLGSIIGDSALRQHRQRLKRWFHELAERSKRRAEASVQAPYANEP